MDDTYYQNNINDCANHITRACERLNRAINSNLSEQYIKIRSNQLDIAIKRYEVAVMEYHCYKVEQI